MKRNFYLLLACLFACFTVTLAQTVTLTFTAKDAANHHVQLNRVTITNLTKSWQETIYWPDTVLTMQNGTGIDDYTQNGGFALSQNNPNPFTGTTEVSLSVAKEGEVGLQIADVNGKIIVTQNLASLQPGVHQFRITLSTVGTYVMTARQNGQKSSIKMVCNGGGNGNKIENVGSILSNDYLPKPTKLNPKGATANPFNFGDQMEYVGYTTINGAGVESQHITQVQQGAETIVLMFGAEPTDALPCPGTPTVTDYDGNIYNTVQIGTQCWMKENLRTAHYANGASILAWTSQNDTCIYYYYDNTSSNLTLEQRGYLYDWLTVMHGMEGAIPEAQGICPNGWHVPSDAEWTIFTDYVSSQSQYVCGGNNESIAKALSSQIGWVAYSSNICTPGNDPLTNNATNFSAFPTGYYDSNFGFGYAGLITYFWSSTWNPGIGAGATWIRSLGGGEEMYNRGYKTWNDRVSVRCVRD